VTAEASVGGALDIEIVRERHDAAAVLSTGSNLPMIP
jgi:hypothetical protein